MDETQYDEEAPVAPPTPDEQRIAERIFDALEQLDPDALIAGNLRDGRMRLTFDGEVDLIQLVRVILRTG